jgi:hypothetical protein
VKDGRRPLDRKLALGDIGGLKTPLLPFMPFRFPDVRCDVISAGYNVLCTDRVGVYDVIEAWVAILDCTENCNGEIVTGSTTWLASSGD